MPDVSRLGTKNRKALLSCIEAKVEIWKRRHPGRKLKKRNTDAIFRSCSKKLGLET